MAFAKPTFLSLAASIAAFSIYLLISRYPYRWFVGWSDVLALSASVVVGAVVLNKLTYEMNHRTSAVIVFIPVTAGILFVYAIVFVCAVFGDCL